jgi:hypothetical protein
VRFRVAFRMHALFWVTLWMLLETDLLETARGRFSRNKSSAYTGRLVLLPPTRTPDRVSFRPQFTSQRIP